MPRLDILTIEGYEFGFLSGDGSADGVIIPTTITPDILRTRKFLNALEIAIEIHKDHDEFGEASNYYRIYTPSYRVVSRKVAAYRDKFISEWVNESQESVKSFLGRMNHKPQLPMKMEGYIYLIQAIEPNNHYKIGLSNNPISRIEKLNVKLPFPVEVIHLIKTDDMNGLEKSLHEQYAHKRVNGEWFALSPEDVQEICAIKGVE